MTLTNLGFNDSGSETVIFQDHYINVMIANALLPCVAKSSAAMALNMQDKWVRVFHKEGFQLPAPFQWQEMICFYLF